MYQLGRLRVAISIVICFLLQAQGVDKYTDENRRYEFGFKIDGQQHRHEEKDKEGIIMGEFGFITADDVYHVTVYATDKEGRFKILSMKNIHLKSSPETNSRQGYSRALEPSQKVPHNSQNQGPQPQAPAALPALKPFEHVSLEPPTKSCSSCSIPTTTKPAPPPLPQTYNQANYNNPIQPGFAKPQNQPGIPASPSRQSPQQSGPGSSPNGFLPQSVYSGQNYPIESEQLNPKFPGQNGSPERKPKQYDGPPQLFGNTGTSQQGQNYPQQQNYPQALNYPQGQNYPQDQNYPQGQTYPQVPQGSPAPPSKPTLLSAQMQIVDKNTDVHRLRPGEKEGLPPGLSKHDMVRLLYTFNYTLGFHGHFEEGYSDGIKKGYYFVTGRDGVKMRIDYVADDTGFHPKVSSEVLDLLSDDVPKSETEKDAKYGLRGYEFKWLYYPVDS